MPEPFTYRIYCLYASLRGEEPSPWLIAAEDEWAWEGDEDRCEAVFAKARKLAEENKWDVREVVLSVPLDPIWRAFLAAEVQASVLPVASEAAPGSKT